MSNGLSAIEHSAPVVLDELRHYPERFYFDNVATERDHSGQTDGQLLFMMGVVVVPVETAVDFLSDNYTACVDHKSYAAHNPGQAPLAVRFTVCHPPKPLSRTVAEPALKTLETTYHTSVAPMQRATAESTDAATMDYLRQSDLLKPQYHYHYEHGGYFEPRPSLLGGLALFTETDENDAVSGQFFMNRQRLQNIKSSLRTTSQDASNLYQQIISLELPTTEQLQQLVMPRLQTPVETDARPAAVSQVA